MDKPQIEQMIDELPDDVLNYVAQSYMPWQNPYPPIGGGVKDEDGFLIGMPKDFVGLPALQQECWNKFVDNPQINSHVRDFMGSLTGHGFRTISDIPEIQEVVEEIEEDPRNALYRNMSKYVARSEIEGELFLCLTLHTSGFVEVDFMDPQTLKGGGDSNSGIWFHPRKKTLPLMYRFEEDGTVINIPSINIAYFPTMYSDLKKSTEYAAINAKDEKDSRTSARKFAKVGGFKRFIVSWDRGFLTKRNISHIKTTIIWINHYENLKKWEIDHKKSSGSYLWVATMADAKTFRTWLKLTPEEKAQTGLFSKKTPGGTIVLPPGITLECKNPALPRISDTDTDIMHMVTSGLNKPEDMVTGVSAGSTFSGVNASRGPESDRTQNEISYFERFLQFELWKGIFYLRSAVTSFPTEFVVDEVTDFVNKKPKMTKVKKKVHKLLSFEFPTSEVSDLESKAKAYLGSKHPSLVEYLGLSRAEVAKRLGFPGYRSRRMEASTEEETLPELQTAAEIESAGETVPKNEDGTTKPSNSGTAKPPEKPAPAKK